MLHILNHCSIHYQKGGSSPPPLQGGDRDACVPSCLQVSDPLSSVSRDTPIISTLFELYESVFLKATIINGY